MSDSLLGTLRAFGCDVDGALARMLGDENFLYYCIRTVLDQEEFDQLGDALLRQDATRAFECAHALKGVCANTGLDPLLTPLGELIEPLRRGETPDLSGAYNLLIEQREALRTIVPPEMAAQL